MQSPEVFPQPRAGLFSYAYTMRLFVYEYTCALDRAQEGSPSLRVEGWAMLRAVLEDSSRISGIELTTCVAANATEIRSQVALLPVRLIEVNAANEPFVFRDLVDQADAVLVIAPEFEDLLYQRSLCVEQAGSRLLGSSSRAVRLAGDKLLLARRLAKRNIPTPATRLVRSDRIHAVDAHQDRMNAVTTNAIPSPTVIKPRYGAGSQATLMVGKRDELVPCLARARQEGWHGEMVLQPFIRGLACSVAFLMGPNRCVALPPCRQHLSDDGRFHYLGGSTPIAPCLAQRAQELGRKAVETVAGLLGYVGVDLVLGDATDGSEDVVIEINPRLTTSYVGLRALSTANLAEALVCAVEGRRMPELGWRGGSVAFWPNGHVA
jgi:predicted ATP-grasp superfamily ATP-dependent carboligase